MMRTLAALLLGILALSVARVQGEEPPAGPGLAGHPGLVDAAQVVPGLQVELKYATADNFLGRDVYGGFRTCYLQKAAADMPAVFTSKP